MNGWEPLYVALAAAMVASTAVFVRWAAEARSRLRESVVVFLLLMMTGMLVGGLLYEFFPGTAGAVAGLWVASAVMSAAAVLVFAAFVAEARRAAAGGPSVVAARAPGPGFFATVIGLVLANEFLMGWALGAASGTFAPGLPAGLSAFPGWAAGVVVSPWFVFTMGAEMLVTVVLLRSSLPRAVSVLLLAQGAIMLLSPPAFPAGGAGSAALAAGSAAMIGLFVYTMELLYRERSLAPGFASYLARLLPVFAVMMAGLFLWELYGRAELFAVAVVLEMIVYFEAVVRGGRFSAPRSFSWQEEPRWTTAVLGTVFVSELFMGAALALLFTPGLYTPGPRLPLTGNASEIAANAASNGFFFVASTTASTWFLLMMGAEMGALVVLRMREVRGRETRLRLGLMLASYAAFAVFYPSVYYAETLPHAPGAGAATVVPVLGWNMGLGSAAVAPTVLATIAASYVVFAVVTVLFGRRAICSVFCSAATMYQGTTLDAMKSFNRRSEPARRYLGSRWSGAYRVTAAAVLVALAGTAATSYLDAIGRWSFRVAGVDPSVFLFDLSFGVVWYALFVTVPYAGEYNCVTMGWCYTGLLAGATSRVGFFRLRVRDREVCRRCTTFDCARSCPVGLVDMPAQFRARGEFRSSKCCGVGDCAEACPYGNLYLADVRHALRRVLRPRHVPGPADRLPMVVPSSAEAPSAPAAGAVPTPGP